MTEDELDAYLAGLPAMPPAEQRETLLRYFVAILDTMTPLEIEACRADLSDQFPPSPEQTMFFELMDGHLALRELPDT